MDPRLEKSYVEGEMFRMIEAAAACIRHSAAKRPRMVQVVGMMNSPYTILNWFADFQGNLRLELTTDGLHLSAEAYDVWRSAIDEAEYSTIAHTSEG